MLRPETRTRARALQLLYAWEVQQRPPMRQVADGLLRQHPEWDRAVAAAESLAAAVAADVARLDGEIERAAHNWRLERIGTVEQNILRLALYELSTGDVPPRVAISEAVRLAHWFAGSKAPSFVNGVLDAVARQVGRL
ncbi:MAG: transcription antitermination factor NusB [Gemmatimonadales bacterium]|nr:transcription antitermination factor NusB [Gemmatimonadales bacterium]NIN12806.1 transcription antitermination factor NusB [Gemmatimonadales bacterium]NIN48734.1 transcription antitermination factor NusB [Gemmatimonadales bacterium]NIP06198.1 transcription antitermination factor NusB [Gemmatimonadales bacterium]NIR01383.1 transcription antitermination factor NusB [Gemmatimonadales bacterium]